MNEAQVRTLEQVHHVVAGTQGGSQTMSEAYLLPVIKEMFEQFPFKILGFHSYNGSEYVNGRVADLLSGIRQRSEWPVPPRP